ncbi:MAG: hypothetical protein ACYCXA_07845 [Actinomycetes bacterium]
MRSAGASGAGSNPVGASGPPREPPGVHPEDLVRLAHELDQVVERLRGMSGGRLEQPAAGGPTRAAIARAVAQQLWAMIEAVHPVQPDGPDGPVVRTDRDPVSRVLPVLDAVAAGDQLAVVGYELLAALARVRAAVGDNAWVLARVEESLGRLRELRRAL